MAINTSSGDGIKTNYVGYSNFFGSLTLETDENKKRYADAKALVGEAEVKKSFSGSGPDTATGKARKSLKDAGVPVGFTISGKLINTYFREYEDTANNKKYQNLRVVLQDNDNGVKENTVLTLDLQGDLAHKLIQKLEYATPGEQIDIGAWSSLEANPKDPAGPVYAKHNVSVKENGQQVKVPEGVKHYDKVKELVAVKFGKLESADFDREKDKVMFQNARKAVTADYFTAILIDKIAPKFANSESEKADIEAGAGHSLPEPEAGHPAFDGGFDEHEFDPGSAAPRG